MIQLSQPRDGLFSLGYFDHLLVGGLLEAEHLQCVLVTAVANLVRKLHVELVDKGLSILLHCQFTHLCTAESEIARLFIGDERFQSEFLRQGIVLLLAQELLEEPLSLQYIGSQAVVIEEADGQASIGGTALGIDQLLHVGPHTTGEEHLSAGAAEQVQACQHTILGKLAHH